jgi:two-component system cell cycle sensor histidine kinase/response regulator CckA
LNSERKSGDRTQRIDRRHDTIFKSLFETNPQPMWICDNAASSFVSVNDAAVQHYGYTRDEFLNMSLNDIVASAGVHAELKAHGIERHRKKDGTIIDVEVLTHSIRIDARAAQFSLMTDVTAKRRADEALLRTEARYHDLFENANDAIFIVDANLRFRDANKKAAELLGWSRDELLRMSIPDIIPQEQKARSAVEFEKLRREGAYEKFVGKVRTRDNHWLDVEVSSSAIMDGGKVIGSRDIMRDISDRKRMEEEMLRAQKLESIGVLAGGIAHDFNNLLTAILGNITLAKIDSPQAGPVHNRLVEAERAVARAQDLTQQLLTFSRGGAPVTRVLSLAGLLRDTVTFSLRGSKTLSVFSLPGDIWNVDADAGQVSQVFNNLAINADQAMPEGGKLHIRCENVTVAAGDIPALNPGKYVRVSFADNGIGIAKDHIVKVFDPYFTTKQKGSGLGLATSYSVVKRHGGLLAVESELGTGATFHVYLPATEAPAPAGEAFERPMVQGAGRILVVDDEEMIRQILERVLNRYGYEAVCVHDGKEALSQYGDAKRTGKPFNAVIMDLTIPGGMGGQEAVKHLRKIDPHAKVIVSSGYSNDPVMARFREYGFDGVVTKPFSVATLGAEVRKVLSGE